MAPGSVKRCIIRSLSLLAVLLPLLDAEVRTGKVFGPETATGPYKHPSAIAELDNGDLFLVYYGGGGEYALETAVFGARRPAGTHQWTRPAVIATDPFRSLGNAVVWQAPDGVVWLFYVVRYGDTWSTSRIQVKISRDGAVTWSDSSLLAPETGDMPPGMMVRNQPIVLPDGDYLLPVYHETGGDREIVGPDSTSRFLRFNPKTKRWSQSGVIHSPNGNIQPAPALLGDGSLIAYCRRGGGYGEVNDGYIVRAESRDNGHTWSQGVNSAFPNPNSAIDLLRLRNGHLMLFYNPSMSQRTPLRASVSADDGRTWPRSIDIASGNDSFAYPYAIQKKDGSIAVVYTSDKRRQINLAEFDEAEVAPSSERR